MTGHWLSKSQRNGGLTARVAETLPMLGYTLFTFSPLAWVFTMSLKDTATIRSNPYSIPLDPRWANYTDVLVHVELLAILHQQRLRRGAGDRAADPDCVDGCLCLCPDAVSRLGVPVPRHLRVDHAAGTGAPDPVVPALVRYGLINTLTGLALVYVAVQLPMAIYILRSFFAQIPRELSEAARMDGCSEWKIFWRIMMPIATPAISTILIVNFVALWNEFIFAVIFIQDESKRTLPLGVMKFVGDVYEDLGHMAAGLVISIIPVLALYMFFSEKFIRGMSAGAVKG